MAILPVILSGGAGTRLWPSSREHYPKQLLAPFGEFTLLQATVERLSGLDSPCLAVRESNEDQHRQEAAGRPRPEVLPPLIVCNEEYRFLVAEQLRELGKESCTIILEPFGRNTAPATTIAALFALEEADDPVLLVMPADHLIQQADSFHDAVIRGSALAERGYLVTFGIAPTRPETGYGYMKLGDAITDPDNLSLEIGYHVQKFIEKPESATAGRFYTSGQYLWNSGIFMMRAATWLEKIGQFRPDILRSCRTAHVQGSSDGNFYHIDPESFAATPSDSIDYAVMEKLASNRQDTEGRAPESGRDPIPGNHAAVIPLEAGWSDVGAWSSLWDVVPPDAQGNIIKGDVYTHETHNSLLIAQQRLVAGIGLEDMIVIETADAVMVAHKDHAQNVRYIVSRLKEEGRDEYLSHRRVHRPWGFYESMDSGARFQVKRITVKPHQALSLQLHHHRAEHWVVVRGRAKVTKGNDVFMLGENESAYIPRDVKHRLENPDDQPLEIIEVQSGDYLGEDDILRFDDNYGRE